MKWILMFLVVCNSAQAFDRAAVEAIQPAAVKAEASKELLLFWATWCPECREKITSILPGLDKSGALKGIGVTLVNVEQDRARVDDFLKKNPVAFEVVRDSDRKLRKELKLFSVPAWAVYEKGKVVASGQAFDKAKVNEALGKQVFQ